MSKYLSLIFTLNRERRHLAGISRSKELAGKDAGAPTACFRGLLCNCFRASSHSVCPGLGRLHARAELSPAVSAHFIVLAQGARTSACPTVATAVPAADIGWREFFRDPRLQQLIELALTNNLDLRVAMLNVEQTRALYHVQRDALVPTVDINANGSRQRIPFGFGGEGNGFNLQSI